MTEQLPLLPEPTASRLRLSDHARRLGLAGVARARQVLDDAARRRTDQEAAATAERQAAAEHAGLRSARRPAA